MPAAQLSVTRRDPALAVPLEVAGGGPEAPLVARSVRPVQTRVRWLAGSSLLSPRAPPTPGQATRRARSVEASDVVGAAWEAARRLFRRAAASAQSGPRTAHRAE